MSAAIPEADWRVFRSLHPIWIERFCKRVNGELMRVLSDDSRDAYGQYLAAARRQPIANPRNAGAKRVLTR